MKKSKVLVSAYAFNPAGSLQLHPGEDITGWKLAEQINRFHDVWVITHTYNKEAVEKALSQGALPGARIFFINLPEKLRLLYKIEFAQRIYYYLWQIWALRKARELHREINFDLAHHVTFGNDWMPSFIGAMLPVPFIWGPVGGGQKIPRGLRKELSFYGRFAEAARSMAQWFGRHHYFRSRCLKKARAVLVCNRETKEKIPEKYHFKTFYFPVNGISSEVVKKEISEIAPKRPFTVFTAGRLHRLKGFALAIKSFQVFSQRFPKSEFIIVGKGPEQQHLHKLTRELGLNSNLKFLDWMSQDKLFEMMKASDVFLFPSFRDGGGAVVVEAMASGKPVVCLNAAGPGFHIQEKWGFKIEPRSPGFAIQEMAKALEKLYLDQSLRKRMGEAARRRADEFYVWDRLGDRLQDIYKEVLFWSKCTS